MQGKIRTKQRCPECGGKFEDIGWALICRKHLTSPDRYFIDIWKDGRRYKLYSDTDGRVLNNYELTKRVLTEIRQRIDKHRFDPKDYIVRNYQKLQFDAYVLDWLAHCKDLQERNEISPATMENRNRITGKYIIPFFQKKKMDIRDIRAGDIEDFRLSLPKDLELSSQAMILGILHTIFASAKKRKEIKEIPDFPDLKPEETKTIWMGEDEQETILQCIPEKHRPIFLFMMRQGVRPGEARALRFEDIDWKNRTVTICRTFSNNKCQEKTKTRKIRVLPLDDEVYDMLKAFGTIQGFVFTYDGKPYSERTRLNKVWKAAVDTAGLKHVKMYAGTRHSFASQAVNRGVPLNLIGDFLGHTNTKTTRRYAHLDVSGLKIVLDRGPKIVKMKKAVESGGNRPQTVPGENGPSRNG